MSVLVTGDRNWADYGMIKDALARRKYTEAILRIGPPIVIHGAAKGADRLAGYAAKSLGLEVREYPADWKLGKAAGVIRNQQMLDSEKVDLVLAFHDDLENSKGTKDMVERAKKAGIAIRRYSHEHPEGVVIQ